jgi:hypothetical protein
LKSIAEQGGEHEVRIQVGDQQRLVTLDPVIADRLDKIGAPLLFPD